MEIIQRTASSVRDYKNIWGYQPEIAMTPDELPFKVLREGWNTK
jgi:hypothetical protein